MTFGRADLDLPLRRADPALAAARLQRTGVARSQVASRLGYSDARALRRAARRWERE